MSPHPGAGAGRRLPEGSRCCPGAMPTATQRHQPGAPSPLIKLLPISGIWALSLP